MPPGTENRLRMNLPQDKIRILSLLLLWLAAAVALVALAEQPDPSLNNGMDLYLSTEYESQAAQVALREVFPEYRFSYAAIIFHQPDGLRGEDWRKINQLLAWLNPNDRQIAIEESKNQFARQDLIDAPVISYRTTPQLTSRLNSASGKSTLVVIGMPDIFTAKRTQNCVQELGRYIDSVEWGSLQVELGGDAGFYADYASAARESVDRSTLITVALVVGILLLVYRSPAGVLVPLITIGTAVIVAVRLLYLGTSFGLTADPMIEMFIVVLLFGSGTDYCLFIFARYREELEHETRPAAAMWRAWKAVASSIAASALTTMVGLSLMVLAEFRAFQKAGPSISLALGIGCLASLTLAPALYVLAGRYLSWPITSCRMAKPLSGRLWPALTNLVTRRPGLITIAVVTILLLPSMHAMRSRTSYNIFEELSDDWSSFRAFHIINREYKGGMMGPMTLLVRGNQSLHAGDGWKAMADLSARLAEQPVVAEVIAPNRPQGLEGMVYDKPQDMHLFWQLGVQSYFYSESYRAARIEILFHEGPYTDNSLAGAELVRSVAHSFADQSPVIEQTLLAGPSSTLADIRRVSRRDLTVVTLAVLLATYVILLILLRRPLLSLILIAGTMLSFGTALGAADLLFVRILGQAGLDWKIHFFLLVLLVVVGVDYNIYICSRIREENRKMPMQDAVRVALSRTGSIISACGIIVAGTFASMMFGRLSLAVQLGFALAVGILADTFLVRPLLVPALILLLDRLKQRKTPPGPPGDSHPRQATGAATTGAKTAPTDG